MNPTKKRVYAFVEELFEEITQVEIFSITHDRFENSTQNNKRFWELYFKLQFIGAFLLNIYLKESKKNINNVL